jgi:hypothetical protein
MFFVFAWVDKNQDKASFESRIPLRHLGRSMRRHGSKDALNLLFLDGYSRLSSEYIAKLKKLGFNVVNLSVEVKQLVGAFQSLQRFGKYEMLCFLRWPALAHFLKKENFRKQLIHIDGDIIFNADPGEIANDVKGLTFILQGCPAFTTITNYDWFECYYEELVKFSHDIEGYSSKAWSERLGWEKSYIEKWAGIWDRQILSSDQDFINYLVHTGRIVQDNPVSFVKQLKLYYTENPLYFDSHARIQLSKNHGLSFSSDGDTCYVDGKKIAFWHFQSDFSAYVNAAIVLRKIHYPFRFPNHLNGRFSRLLSVAARRAYPMRRKEIYGWLKEPNPEKSDGYLSFVDIFNSRFYWEKGTFINPPPQ